MNAASLSVVLVTLDNYARLRKTMAHLAHQTARHSIEIVHTISIETHRCPAIRIGLLCPRSFCGDRAFPRYRSCPRRRSTRLHRAYRRFR